MISLDMGLYQPIEKLQMGQNDLNHVILHPGELHIDMAMCNLCWIEADLYGSATVKQITDDNHIKRGEATHKVTLQALFAMYQKTFFFHQEPVILENLQKVSEDLAKACTTGSDVVYVGSLYRRLASRSNGTQAIYKVFLCS